MEEHQVYSSKAFSDSDRLNEANVTIFKRMRNLPAYEQFNETIKMQRKAKDKQEIILQGLETLTGLRTRVEIELKDTIKQIEKIKYPNRSSSDMQAKLYGQMLVNKAHQDFSVKPKDIHEKLKTALELKENEYIFEIRDLYVNDEKTTDLDKAKVRNFVNELEELLNLPEIENRKNNLDAELIQVRRYFELLDETPELYEAEIDKSVKVAKIMYENGQFEGSSILLS